MKLEYFNKLKSTIKEFSPKKTLDNYIEQEFLDQNKNAVIDVNLNN